MEMSFGSRLKHAWNAFTGNIQMNYRDLGMSYSYRADRPRMSRGNERSIVTSVYNRIALDVAALNVQHVRLDENGRFLSVIDDGLNNCLTLEANVDQTARSFIQDVVISMFDEGSVAIVPVDTTTDPNVSGSYDIQSLRVGQILDWYPQYIRTRVYNEQTGRKEDIVVPKSAVAIIENPLYAVINEPNSTMLGTIGISNTILRTRQLTFYIFTPIFGLLTPCFSLDNIGELNNQIEFSRSTLFVNDIK